MTNGRSLRSVLLRVLKISGIVVLVVLILFGLASWILFQKKNELLHDEIIAFVDKSQSGQLEVEHIDLKLFRSFPDITIELKGINYYEHRDSLRATDEKPILTAGHLFVALELMPLLNDEVKISQLSLSKAQLDIVENKNGKLNLELALSPPVRSMPAAVKDTTVKKTTTPKSVTGTKSKPPAAAAGSAIEVNLEFISLDDLDVSWKPYNSTTATLIFIDKLNTDLALNKGVLTAKLDCVSDLKSVHKGKAILSPGKLDFDGAVQYDIVTRMLTVQKGNIKYNELSATIDGSYVNEGDNNIDLVFDASSNDLELLSMVLKPEVLRQNPDLLKTGDIYIKGQITGPLRQPAINVSFGLTDLTLRLPRNLGNFSNVTFDGTFASGNASNYSDASLVIRKIKGQLPEGFIMGAFSVHNFVDPYLKYDLDAQLKVDGYDQVFNIPAIKQLKGIVSVHANFDGRLKQFDQHRTDSTRSSIIRLDSISFILSRTNLPVTGLSGEMKNKDNTATIKDLTFNYGTNNLTVNATVDNLVFAMFGRSDEIAATGTIRSSQLHTKDFLFDTTATAYVDDRIRDLAIDFQANTMRTDSSSAIPDIAFTIQKLTAELEKLPDLKLVTAKGTLKDIGTGLRLDVTQFHASLPNGKLDVTGDLLIPGGRKLAFNARLVADKFPVNYVQELIVEIQAHKSGTLNKTVDQMDLVTAKVDLTAAIITRPFSVTNLVIRNSEANFRMPDSRTLSATKMNVSCSDLSFNYDKPSGVGLKSTNGRVSMRELKVPGLGVMDLDFAVYGKNDSVRVDFSRGVPDTDLEQGNLFVDFSKEKRSYELNYIVKGAKLENYIRKFYKNDLLKGEVDYKLDLAASGSTMNDLKQSISGTIEISGDSIDLYGINVDKILRKFERSQHFNLTDLGAVLVAGPVGLAVTKGTDFVSLASVDLKPGHHTFIQSLKTKWDLKDLILTTEDVAFATLENRIALNGTIDLAHDSIPGLTIAVVDKNGCSLMEQPMYGKLSAIKTGELKIAKTLFGSVINFVNNVVGKDCKPVYTGTVAAPNEPEKRKRLGS